jgi:hypothetical protein
MVLLDHGFSNYFCASICWCITISGWAFEILRLHIPALRQAVMNSFMGSILRKEEHHQAPPHCLGLGARVALMSLSWFCRC